MELIAEDERKIVKLNIVKLDKVNKKSVARRDYDTELCQRAMAELNCHLHLDRVL